MKKKRTRWQKFKILWRWFWNRQAIYHAARGEWDRDNGFA